MSSSPTPSFEGSCACGASSYQIRDDALTDVGICHCKICQAWCGGMFLYVETTKCIIADSEKFLVWKSSEHAERASCKICGSNMYCRITEPGPMYDVYHVAAGTLKDWKDLRVASEIFIDRKPSAYSVETDKPTEKMTKKQCYEAWGVPVGDEE